LSAFASAALSGVDDGTSLQRSYAGLGTRALAHTSSDSPPEPRSASVARAFVTQARSFGPDRISRSSFISGLTSSSATTSGSKSAKTSRRAGRLRSTVSQDSPDWKPSRQTFSYSACSERCGRPHSRSW